MIRFEKGLGDQYRMAVTKISTMTQAVQDQSFVEGSWVQLKLDPVTGEICFDLLPATKAGADTGFRPGISAAPLVSNPATPEHSGPFVPMGVAVDRSDILYTDQFDSGNPPAVGDQLCASQLTVGGVTIQGLRTYNPAGGASATGDAAVTPAQAVIGTCLGVNLAGELVVLWHGR